MLHGTLISSMPVRFMWSSNWTGCLAVLFAKSGNHTSVMMEPGSQGEGPGRTCVNKDDFTVLVTGGPRCHWVSTWPVWPSHSKRLSEQSHESASDFALSLNIPLRNYSDGAEGCSCGQLVTGSFVTTTHRLMHHVSCRDFGRNIKSLGWLSPI